MGKTNIVMLIGNLGKDIEMKHFDNGGCIGRTSLATTEKYKNKTTGETIEDTEWHNLVFSGKGAEIAEKYTQKGSKIAVTGRIKYRSWEHEGKTNYMTEIKVRDFEFLDSKGSGVEDATQNSSKTTTGGNQGSVVDAYNKETAPAPSSTPPLEKEDDSDLPF